LKVILCEGITILRLASPWPLGSTLLAKRESANPSRLVVDLLTDRQPDQWLVSKRGLPSRPSLSEANMKAPREHTLSASWKITQEGNVISSFSLQCCGRDFAKEEGAPVLACSACRRAQNSG